MCFVILSIIFLFFSCRDCRVKDYITAGLDSKIVDPDGGANVAAKAEKLRSAGVSNPNLKAVPPYPADGWESNLASLPMFTFRTICQHFTERSVHEVVTGKYVDASACVSSHDDDSGGDDDSDVQAAVNQKFRAHRGLDKGYRFFKSGHVHVQKLQFHDLPSNPGFCYILATVLPSMRKDRQYKVRLYCTTSENASTHVSVVSVALCTCPAGLAGSCNHIAGLLYALEDFAAGFAGEGSQDMYGEADAVEPSSHCSH